ncbi:MAG: elongation factor 4 [Dehalococcoidia bacterium]|nr:elongation factor 4 [Dehalococcoidia bacterium]MBK9545380.1 elongation factor 4 [Dehalococcoidia bacterium]MBK9611853.1 elongation factor 4 [Dehalococcoidia bacterium]
MGSVDQSRIRNFCIIAHIDHGKSTLADRLLETTGTVSKREMSEQLLDSMDLEREKGITIKAAAARMSYTASDGETYELNLIDTPGHVDFTYEVSRSLAACEGALLVVDASQGIEAQTLANVYLAMNQDLKLIPVLNKIDLPHAEPERVSAELTRVIGFDPDEMIAASAKEGTGVPAILEALVQRIPRPRGNPEAPLKALIFDSKYDAYKGVVAHVRVFEGRMSGRKHLLLMQTGATFEPLEFGAFSPAMRPLQSLECGEVGYVATGLKDVADCRVGDTITLQENPAPEALPGYRQAKPMVFAGIYPTDSDQYQDLREALAKLVLNDASLVYEPESSVALGFGFRCGFLGLLHLEIVGERLEREYGLSLLTTAPSVEYHVQTTGNEEVIVDNPADLPDPSKIAVISEPWAKIDVITPSRYIGQVMDLVTGRRGQFLRMEFLEAESDLAPGEARVLLEYDIPMAEILVDFYDHLKGSTSGYASLDYHLSEYRPARLVKVDILVNGVAVDALSLITHSTNADREGRVLVSKLKDLIPRQMFDVPIQAAVGGKIISRETIRAMRKNVLAKCYGGDISRKRKLLEKQAEGKKKMKRVGNVEIPQEAFMAVLRLRE